MRIAFIEQREATQYGLFFQEGGRLTGGRRHTTCFRRTFFLRPRGGEAMELISRPAASLHGKSQQCSSGRQHPRRRVGDRTNANGASWRVPPLALNVAEDGRARQANCRLSAEPCECEPVTQ